MQEPPHSKQHDEQHDEKHNDDEDCTLTVVYIGSAQTSGHDNFHNVSYPYQTRSFLTPLAHAAGLTLRVWNHAYDSDLSREGPQTFHMCIGNWMPKNGGVDVISWDFDGNLARKVVRISPGHDAIVYNDQHPNNLPTPRNKNAIYQQSQQH
mmetsp:Transcript_1701/g.3393  ORF Transcript_1701/g.3393 Transcript_1701/m.3393 type:complete len:151 (+) Transcript_1701:589-1041(+)